ncbi:hypothetical protein GCM10023107_09220 [Actinoplanes octamycinicus]
MSDESGRDRTQELFLPAVVTPVPPQHGGAEVVEVAAYRGDTVFEREVIEKLAAAAARSVPGWPSSAGTWPGSSTRCSTRSAWTRSATRPAG